MQKTIKVKPNSKQQSIKEVDGSLTISLKLPPVDGKANEELIKLLAKHFDIPKSRIAIKLGLASRQKVVEIELD